MPEDMISHRWKRDTTGDSLFADQDATDKPGKVHPLDAPQIVALHQNLLGNYQRELDKQSPNRRDMELDEDIYDHIQWNAADASILTERGQIPLVFNVTATAVNWILGSERRNPSDYKILARQQDGVKHAERKSQLMKYLSDVNNSPMHVSRAFSEQVKAGLSWLETGMQDEDDGEIVYDRMESWRNIIYDSSATEIDLSDGRYKYRVKWTDVDRAQAMFRDRMAIIAASSDNVFVGSSDSSDTFGDTAMDSWEEANLIGFGQFGLNMTPARRRVRLYECWFRRPVEEKFIRGGQFSGDIYDPRSEGHRLSVENQRCQVVSKVKERVMVALFCEKGMLYLDRSPYRHNRYPFTPIWGYRRSRDGMPYGWIRGVRDIQMDLNKRASKALWHSTAKRAMMAQGTVDDIEQFREEMHRPDAILIYKTGQQPPVISNDLAEAAAQLEMMNRDIQMIEQTGGVTQQNQGRPASPNQSGKAIGLLQDQGELTTNVFFENLRFAKKIHGEKVLSNIEQFFTEEKSFRITNSRGNAEYIAINDENPDDDNWITRTKADFIVSEQDYRATHRQANLQALIEMVSMVGQADPQFIRSLMDLIVESMDVPKQDEIVKRIRKLTGEEDPDADPNNPDPEALAIKAQKAEAMQKAERAADAQLATLEAKAASETAKAGKTEAETAQIKAKATATALSEFEVAVRTAMSMMTAPAAGRMADAIMQAALLRATELDQTPLLPTPPAQPAAIPPQPQMPMAMA